MKPFDVIGRKIDWLLVFVVCTCNPPGEIERLNKWRSSYMFIEFGRTSSSQNNLMKTVCTKDKKVINWKGMVWVLLITNLQWNTMTNFLLLGIDRWIILVITLSKISFESPPCFYILKNFNFLTSKFFLCFQIVLTC